MDEEKKGFIEVEKIKFFDVIHKLGIVNDDVKIDLTISTKGEHMTAVIKFGSMNTDVKIDEVSPIRIRGTKEDLNEGFINILKTSSEDVQGLIVDNKAFEESLKKANKTKTAKTSKEKTSTKVAATKPEVKEDLDEKLAKEKIEEVFKKGEEHIKAKEYDKVGLLTHTLQTPLSKVKKKSAKQWITNTIDQIRQMSAKLNALELFPDYEPRFEKPWEQLSKE